jgi:hypothetical protein
VKPHTLQAAISLLYICSKVENLLILQHNSSTSSDLTIGIAPFAASPMETAELILHKKPVPAVIVVLPHTSRVELISTCNHFRTIKPKGEP